MKYYGLICYTGIKQIYKDLAMKKLCPVCNTLNEAIGFNLSEKEITQTAYHKAYEAWKDVASIYQAIDYNLNMNKHAIKMKETSKIRVPKTSEPVNIELLCQQILSTLSKEQQQAIIRTFKATQTIGN